MPISFTINKPRQILQQQWAYLVQRGQNNKLSSVKKVFKWLVAITIAYLLLYTITAVNDLISLKVVLIVLIAIGWCVFAVVFLLVYLSKFRSKLQLQKFLSSIGDDQINYSVQIDEDKVTISSLENSWDLPWSEFSYYGIHQMTLYVFNDVNRMNSLYWDEAEMGTEAFSALIKLLQQKSMTRAF